MRLRKLLQNISSLLPIRYLVLIFIKIGHFIERIWSNLKFKALITNSGNSTCHYSTEIKYGYNIKIGHYSRIGPNCTLGALSKIHIGDNVVISKGVTIETAGLDYKEGPPYKRHKSSPITIENGTWIGSNVIILGGVIIGENSIIGAGCVITKNIPQNSVIVGMSNRKL